MEKSKFKRVDFCSTMLEPTAAHCVGVWHHNCEMARELQDNIAETCKKEKRDMTFREMLDSEQFIRECQNWWYGMKALDRLSIATRGAIHFGIAINNEQSRVADYIKKYFGFCPILDKEKSKSLGFSSL